MKIKTLKIQSFRGIPNELIIDFNKNGKCASLILFGDNGSGKSSIIDAIEFCLQARIYRQTELKNNYFPFPISFYSNKDSKIEIVFDKNDTVFSRKILLSKSELEDDFSFVPECSKPHNFYRISPIVLRRKDILDFTNAPIRKKQMVLFDFLRDSPKDDWDLNPPEKIEKLSNEKLKIKNKRKLILEQLAVELKIEVNQIPFEATQLGKFIHEKIYKGLNSHQRLAVENRGMKLSINTKALKLVEKLTELNLEISKISKELNDLSKGNIIRFDKKNITAEILRNASEFISDAFNKISKINYIERIHLTFGKESEISLNIDVELKNGKTGTPNNIFSEAYLDLIALLVFLSFLKESTKFGQSKLLILDDVLQSVDSTIRSSFADFLIKEFIDWQLIISAHDRLWLNQLKNLFRQNNHNFIEKEIIRWDFSGGPILKDGSSDLDEELEKAIEIGQFEFICSQTSKLLELVCNELSFRFSISVKRKYEDKYTLGDLWPGIFKIIKTTNLKIIAENVEASIILRNLIGAHYNIWAYTLSSSEAYEFGNSALALYRHVYCKSCNTWIENVNNGKLFQCKCKSLNMSNNM